MNRLIILVLVIISHSAAGQVGQQAAQIAIDIGTSTAAELPTLIAISANQNQVLDYSQEIANKTAAIAVLKEAELMHMNTTPDDFEETTPWKRAVGNLDAIIRLNSNTLQLLTDFPNVSEIPITVTAAILLKAEEGFYDIEAILTDGNDNLMYATDRYALTQKISIYLDKLREVSRVVNIVVRNLVITSGELPTDYTYDMTESMNNIMDQIDNLIIE